MPRLTVTAAVIAVLAVTAGPAAASAPQRFEFDFQDADIIDCAALNPSWDLRDDFVDSFYDRAQVWRDSEGNPLRAIEHLAHTSADVNSTTGFTLHEHNNFTVVTDFVARTITLSGAVNIMQRGGVGEVIQYSGHKVINLDTGEALALRGPNTAADADFCAALAP